MKLYTLPLNFELGHPTINGRIYDKEQLLNQINSRIKTNTLYITSSVREPYDMLDLMSVIGVVTNFDGNIFTYREIESGLKFNTPVVGEYLSISGRGTVQDNKVNNYTLSHLFMTNDHNLKGVNENGF